MLPTFFTFLLLSNSLTLIFARVVPRATNAYAPVTGATCPTSSMVRQATGLSSSETSFISSRKSVADAALSSWLESTDSGFGTSSLPKVGLSSSGGGYRAMLTGGGVIQALDSRDSTSGVAGIFQGLTYHTGLSGGSWLLSSLAGNNYPTITTLLNDLWLDALLDSLLLPDSLLSAAAYVDIIEDIEAKDAAGFDPTLTDPWGRLLSYQLLNGDDGGASITLSGIRDYSNFTSYAVPFPIMVSLGVQLADGDCLPGSAGTQYEFTPYDFGSWDDGVAAFVDMAYLGTSLDNGSPITDSCVLNFDNLGFLLGTSSNLFNDYCSSVPEGSNTSLIGIITSIIDRVHEVVYHDEFGIYRNPFYKYSVSTDVIDDPVLYLVDGGEAMQNNPIWPLIQPYRDLDVILVNDNSADLDTNYPNGSEIYTTYVRAQEVGLTKMPYIPSAEVFVSEGLNERPTFFGCNDTDVITIVYIPNVDYTYDSGTSTTKFEYTKAETTAMIENGNAVVTMNGNSTWPICLGCALMKKTGEDLPSTCTECFSTFCYYN
ncbi:MAG: hypothetical protein M1834_005887 [Cirrosporium novae-zelandiae]|nr:MAG: hypothetical protein M1834_005887 [Cirrosporium novae-zelandiae]